MANLPEIQPKSAKPLANQELLELLAEHIAEGKRPAELARKLAPNNPNRQKKLRKKIREIVWYDPRLAEQLALHAKGEAIMALPAGIAAMGRRAKAGRTDAVKLLAEMTGFHNPRVQHEHSGEIEVKITMPRPKALDPDQEVTDAEVVEE